MQGMCQGLARGWPVRTGYGSLGAPGGGDMIAGGSDGSVLGQGEGTCAGRGERGGGGREKKRGWGRDFYLLLKIERLHSPSVYSTGRLSP